MKLILTTLILITASTVSAVGPLVTMNCDGGITVRAATGEFDAVVRTPASHDFITYLYRYIQYDKQNYADFYEDTIELSIPLSLLEGTVTEGDVTFQSHTIHCTGD